MSEPVVVHAFQELARDGIAGSGTNDEVHRAARAESCLTIVDPYRDFGRRKRAQTIEAATDCAGLDLGTMPAGVLVSLDVRLAGAGLVQMGDVLLVTICGVVFWRYVAQAADRAMSRHTVAG